MNDDDLKVSALECAVKLAQTSAIGTQDIVTRAQEFYNFLRMPQRLPSNEMKVPPTADLPAWTNN